MTKRLRIVLTGVNGQVGFEIAQALAPLVSLYAFKGPSDRASPVQAEALDLADAEALRAAIRRVKPDLIINPAAYTAVDKAESDQERAFQINGTAPGIIGRIAQELGAAVLHFSTDYVYAGEGEHPQNEDAPIAPRNVYGASKWQGEAELMASGAPFITLRTSWVYGLYGHNFVKTMLKLGRERRELKVVADQWGAPTSARTLANFVQQLVLTCIRDGVTPTFARQGGIYHLTDRGCTNWHQFAETIFRKTRELGTPLAVEQVAPTTTAAYPTPAQRPLNSRLSLARIEETFGFHPPHWEDALSMTMAPLLGLQT